MSGEKVAGLGPDEGGHSFHRYWSFLLQHPPLPTCVIVAFCLCKEAPNLGASVIIYGASSKLSRRTQPRDCDLAWHFRLGRPITYIHSSEEQRVGRVLKDAEAEPVWL